MIDTTMLAPAKIRSTPLLDPLGRGEPSPRIVTDRLLVPVDGSRSSLAALRIAAALAHRDGSRIEALAVEPPMTADVSGVSLGAESLRGEPARFGTRIERVRRQLCTCLPGSDWTLHVEFGRVAPTIARMAQELEAREIVIGLSGHAPSRRLFVEPLAGRVLRYSDVPVFAVEARTRALPRRAVVGVDFGTTSTRAALAALRLLEAPGELVLVHVRPEDLADIDELETELTVYEAGVRESLARLARELARDGITTTTRIATGRVAEVLLDTAQRSDAQLIAVGSHGVRFIQRVLVGSVPLQLLHAADRSVLVGVPPKGVA